MSNPSSTTLIIIFFAITVAVLIAQIALRKKRSREIAKLAPLLGLTFAESVLADTKQTLRSFDILNYRSRSYRNFCFGRSAEGDYMLFDYHFRVGGRKNRRTISQSAALLTTHTELMPNISIRPQRLFDSVVLFFGGQDIECGDEYVDGKYVIRGSDVRAVSASFTEPFISFLRQADSNMHLEIKGRQIVYYRRRKLYSAEELEIYQAHVLNLFGQLVGLFNHSDEIRLLTKKNELSW